MSQFLDHLTDDVRPPLFDRLSSADAVVLQTTCHSTSLRIEDRDTLSLDELFDGLNAFCSEKRAAKRLVFFSTGVLLKRHSRASKPFFLSGSS
jgi:hypothetical protein